MAIHEVRFLDPIDAAVYEDPEQLLASAHDQGVNWVASQVADTFEGNDQHLHLLRAVNRSTGLFLGLYGENSQTPTQLSNTSKAVEKWLQDPSLFDSRSHHKYPLPMKEIRRGLFERAAKADWLEDRDTLEILAIDLGRLSTTSQFDLTTVEGSFAQGIKMYAQNELQGADATRMALGDRTLDHKIRLFSAMTDIEALDETMWGKAAISNFRPQMPLAVTQELFNRYVIRDRESFRPVNAAARDLTLGRYILNVTKQAALDPTRNHRNAELLVRDLSVNADEMIAYQRVINVANKITLAMQNRGAAVGEELLDHRSVTATSEALRRLLRITRSGNEVAADRHARQDSLHTAIVNKMATAPIKR